jgi:hypothetical protein
VALLFRDGCVGLDAEARAGRTLRTKHGGKKRKKNGREGGVTRPQVVQKGEQTPFPGLERVLVEGGVHTRDGGWGGLTSTKWKKGKTHASYVPGPTMFKGRMIPPGPPVPSSLDCSLCIARARLFFREGGDALGDMGGRPNAVVNGA